MGAKFITIIYFYSITRIHQSCRAMWPLRGFLGTYKQIFKLLPMANIVHVYSEKKTPSFRKLFDFWRKNNHRFYDRLKFCCFQSAQKHACVVVLAKPKKKFSMFREKTAKFQSVIKFSVLMLWVLLHRICNISTKLSKGAIWKSAGKYLTFVEESLKYICSVTTVHPTRQRENLWQINQILISPKMIPILDHLFAS